MALAAGMDWSAVIYRERRISFFVGIRSLNLRNMGAHRRHVCGSAEEILCCWWARREARLHDEMPSRQGVPIGTERGRRRCVNGWGI